MKFCKELKRHMDFYHINNRVPYQYWFEYKKYKKCLKQIKGLNEIEPYDTDLPECCICLESNTPMMKTFCCNNCIHHQCFIESILHTSTCCPLCRIDVTKFFTEPARDNQERLNYDVLSLISNIYLNIIKIENVCTNMLIIDKTVRQHYIQLNQIALTKICKKIKKYTNIDLKEFFINIINKHGILPKHMCVTRKKSLFKKLLKFIKNINKK
jgi:hypothetical protein